MMRRPPRSTQSRSSAASDVYKRQAAKMVIHRSDVRLGEAAYLAYCCTLKTVLREHLARCIQQTSARLFTGGFDFHFGHHSGARIRVSRLLEISCVVPADESLSSAANAL